LARAGRFAVAQGGLDIGRGAAAHDVDLNPADADQLVAGQATFAVAVTLPTQRGDVGLAAGDALGQFWLRARRPSPSWLLKPRIQRRRSPTALRSSFSKRSPDVDSAFSGDAAVDVAQLLGIHAP
jgi:hypothetical protein